MTLIHLIANNTKPDFQSKAQASIKHLFESAENNDESRVTRDAGALKFQVPIIPDASGMTPFHLVQKLKLNVLLDEMMEHLRFSRLINE